MTSLEGVEVEIDYAEFLNLLAEENPTFKAEQLNLSLAESEIGAAGIRPDPELSFSFFDNQENRLELGYGFDAELSWDLELGGKRKSRIALAESERDLTAYELAEAWADLRMEASLAFAEALKNQMIYNSRLLAYNSVGLLFQTGEDALNAQENKKALRELKKEVNEALYEFENSLIELRSYLSDSDGGEIFLPSGNLHHEESLLSLEGLKVNGLTMNPGVEIARQNKILADNKMRSELSERGMDLGLMLGVESNTFSRNAIAPTPGFVAWKVGLSVPLKFSNFNKAGLEMASYEKQQADLMLKALESEFEKELLLAYRKYQYAAGQLAEFDTADLTEMTNLRAVVVQEYIKGERNFPEVVDTENLLKDLKEEYAELLFDLTEARMELERTVGTWTIDLK